MMIHSTPCDPEILAVLGRTPLFAHLDAEAVSRLAAISRVLDFPEGGPLFASGEPADAFFGVLEGTVHLSTLAPAGDETIIALIERGDTFAEAALFGSGLYPVDGSALPGTRLVRVDGGRFKTLIRDDRSLARALLSGLFRRQVDLVSEIRFLQTSSPVQRLASYLLGLMEAGAWPGDGRLPIRKQVIASRIGIEPESLSRSLARMESLGLLELEPDLRIRDRKKLEAFCGASSRLGLV